MPSDPVSRPTKRLRRWKPKVRTGCKTCKIRRVKCDERKPNCLRCESTGRSCDGYEVAVRTGNGASSSTLLSDCSVILPGPDAGFEGDEQERRSFAFFSSHTVHEFAGFFQSDFWCHYVLQAARYEPAVRHAVIALGSLHERFERDDATVRRSNGNVEDGGFALRHYNMAIGHLIQPIAKRGRQATDVAMTSCALFACFEMLRGHIGSALNHVDSGVKILSELQAAGSTGHPIVLEPSGVPYVPLQNLELVFTRLDSQAYQLIDDRPVILHHSLEDKPGGFGPAIPARFSSVDEARNSLDYHWNRYLCSIRSKRPGGVSSPRQLQELISTRRDVYWDILTRWSSSFDAFLKHSADGLDSRGLQAALVLKIQRKIAFAAIDSDCHAAMVDETIFDKYTPDCEEIIELASALVDAQRHAERTSGRRTPRFSFDTGMLGALFSVANKCREPVVRRKAIALLRAAPRQEGVWDGELVARVAERMVEIEEEGLGEIRSSSEVPDSARISDVDPIFDPEARRGIVTYTREHSRTEPPRQVAQEWMDW